MELKNITSDLKMSNLYFSECRVKRNLEIENGECNANLERQVQKIKEHQYKVKLSLDIVKDDLQVFVEALADFELNEADENREKEIVNTNTVAIMFPFLRSQVTLMTSQPGMTPLVLPPINTAKM